MKIEIPKDLILFLTGVPCVGKTTTAYNLLRKYPEFKSVTEVDIMRTMARSIIRDIGPIVNSEVKLNVENSYYYLFKSVTVSNFITMKKQSSILSKPICEIVKRQQDRKIPTIIEGTSIVPSTFFENNKPIDGFQKNIIFINLYLSDIQEHIQRRKNRCVEREYATVEPIHEKINLIRNDKNDILHKETLELSTKVQNIFSIDIAHMSQNEVVEKISEIISNYFSRTKTI